VKALPITTDLSTIVAALDRLTAAYRRDAWDHVSTILVGLTLLVLIWYTLETYGLRKAAQQQTIETGKLLAEAQRQNEVASKLYDAAQNQNISTANLLTEAQLQNEIAVMPMFAVSVGPQYALLLKNVGLGPAFNVEFKKLVWKEKEVEFGCGDILLDDTSIMTPGETRELKIHVQEANHGWNLSTNELYKWMGDERIPDPLQIVVQCKSLNLKYYEFEFHCSQFIGQLKVKYYRQSSTPSGY
jgi:hypothetical protein